jgi:hypothetical protein
MSGDHNQYQKSRTSEPVGYIYEDDEGRMMFSQMPHPDPLWEPVYKAAPKQWQGLTDEEILAFVVHKEDRSLLRFARAIEGKLREKNTR